MKELQEWGSKLTRSIGNVFYGHTDVIEKILAAILVQGHVLLDDVPGLGKTLLARSLAGAFGAKVSRIQSTPDLMPSDLVGVSIFNAQDSSFRFRKGPVFSNFVLVDEVNRATPRTQSALLEAMAERQVSVEGKSIPLPEPFFIIATQNPVDFEGTFPLPEAQKDRFLLTLSLGYPSKDVEAMILRNHASTEVPTTEAVSSLEELQSFQKKVSEIWVSDAIVDYILALSEATRTNLNLRMGISPRGNLALYRASQALAGLRGRDFVNPDDVKDLIVPVYKSRIILRQAALVKGVGPGEILDSVSSSVAMPHLSEYSKKIS